MLPVQLRYLLATMPDVGHSGVSRWPVPKIRRWVVTFPTSLG